MLLWQVSKLVSSKDAYICHVPSSLITMAERSCFEALPCKPAIWKIWGTHCFWWQQWVIATSKYRECQSYRVKSVFVLNSLGRDCGELCANFFFFFMMNAPVWIIEVKANIAYSSQTSLKPQWKEGNLGSMELVKWSLKICCFGRKMICLWKSRYLHNHQMSMYGKWEKKSYPVTYSAWWIETTYVRGHITPWMLRVKVKGE